MSLLKFFGTNKKKRGVSQANGANTAAAANAHKASNRQIVAVMSAVIAHELGEDVSAIRIHSIKKVS